MKILLSGASGLIGTHARRLLAAQGHAVVSLVRRPPEADEIKWDPEVGQLDAAALEGMDAVVHLAGHNIAAQKRWSPAHKARVRDSRLKSTRLLVETLSRLTQKPPVLVCASATGFYGRRGDELLDESATSGEGFLAELCQAWEGSAQAARQAGIRVVHLRIGIVLAREGGALTQMLPMFRWGLGGHLGDGRQWWSWVTVEEVANIIRFALENPTISGPVNTVAPTPVTNAEFTRILGRAVHRPAVLPAPAFILRALYGEMADELLLSSARVQPAALIRLGYNFIHPRLETALENILPPAR